MRFQVLRTMCAVAVGITAFIFWAPAAHASTTEYTFSGLGDGHSWTDQANWSPSGTPHLGDSIVVQQRPGGPSHVDNVQSVSLAKITLGTGGSLAGAPLEAAQVQWSGGVIYNQITAITLLRVDGNDRKTLQNIDGLTTSGKLIIQDQALLTGGELRLDFGTIINNGTMAAVGLPGSMVLINGNYGLGGPGTLVNNGWLVGSPGNTLRLLSLAIEDKKSLGGGLLGGGTVRLSNSLVHMPITATVRDHVIIDERTILTADGLVQFYGGGVLTEDMGTGSGAIAGTPFFDGVGVFEWLSGTITGELTVRDPMKVDISGPNIHRVDNKLTGPLTIEPGVVVVQHAAGQILLHGGARIVNSGRWRVRDVDGAINGASCCTVPAHFVNRNFLDIEDGRQLTIGNMDYLQRAIGRVQPVGDAPGGVLRISGGVSHLEGGTISGVDVLLTGNGNVAVDGDVYLGDHATVRQTDSVDLTGNGRFLGTGLYRWSDGTITGRVTFGVAVTFKVDNPDSGLNFRKYLYPTDVGGRIFIYGPSVFDSTADVVVTSYAGRMSSIVNHGTMTWKSGLLSYSGLAGSLVNAGTLRVAAGAGNELTEWLSITSSGLITLVSGSLAVKGPSFVQTGGGLNLNGHALSTTAQLRVSGGTLRGPGKITGSVLNTGGAVVLASRGRLTITGSYTQGVDGSVRIVVAGDQASERDQLACGAKLTLAGRLVLARSGTSAIAPYTMLFGSSRSGRFTTITGLGGFPSRYHVEYGAASVRLAR